jgi:hypothetical protein
VLEGAATATLNQPQSEGRAMRRLKVLLKVFPILFVLQML